MTIGEILRLAARKLDAVDLAGEIDDHAVARRRGARVTLLVARALLAQHVDRLLDVLGADLGDGRSIMTSERSPSRISG